MVRSSTYARRCTRLSAASTAAAQGTSSTLSTTKTAMAQPGRIPEVGLHASPRTPSTRNLRSA
eukprot:9712550-Lingulodinium_polyedra.AAC.1